MATDSLPLWWRRRGREWAASFVGIAAMLAVVATVAGLGIRWHGGKLSHFIKLSVVKKAVENGPGGSFVELTLVENAEQKGALCLDGSPAAYHFRKGFGSGADNWVINLEGGAWCFTLDTCAYRAGTRLGSSKKMEHAIKFDGIMNNDQLLNPDFYNWNMVFVRYCDGASFIGDVENQFLQNGSKLFFRGQRIWNAVMDDLLSKGLSSSKQALLTGCSAGGLATFFHCDDFQYRLPNTIVKCMSDAGFFIDRNNTYGSNIIKAGFEEAFNLQNGGSNLNKDCLRNQQSNCFFPKTLVEYIKTPFFILNSAYDWYQIAFIFVSLDPTWDTCKYDITQCNSQQLQTLNGFRETFVSSLNDYQQKGGNMFIGSCYQHCQSHKNTTWHSSIAPRINNKTAAESVGDWFFGRAMVQIIDGEYPSNPTCINDVL